MQRKGKFFLLSVAACLVASGEFVRADATSDARKAIQAAYDRSDAAAVRKDLAGVLASHAPDYTWTDKHGKKHALAELKAQMTQVFQLAKEIRGKTIVKSLSLKGNSATVIAEETGSMNLVNPQKRDQEIKVEVEAKSEDVWTKTPKGWKVKSSKEISSKQLVNGKPAPQTDH
jgi:ketosteroid isomerase-like protein